MSIFHKYERAYGVRLWRWKLFQCELWFCAPRWAIRPHSHPDEDIELCFIFGHKSEFVRQKPGHSEERFTPTFPAHVGKCFSISRGVVHSFTVSNLPLIFISFERWTRKPTSAALDLKEL